MTLPRQFLPNGTCFIPRRATQREVKNIGRFLKEELSLELSREKTLITSAPEGLRISRSVASKSSTIEYLFNVITFYVCKLYKNATVADQSLLSTFQISAGICMKGIINMDFVGNSRFCERGSGIAIANP